MKIVTYIVSALLVATIGAFGLFYLNSYKPIVVDNEKLKAGLPELDKAKKEISKFKEKEAKDAGELAWVTPLMDTFKAGLADEIATGKAEVVSAGNRIVLNIAEQALYTDKSVTFAKDIQTREKLASLLMNLRDREICVGNATQSVPAQGKGRKKIPQKDGRALSADRSLALVSFLEKKGMNPETLAATAYPTKLMDRGFKIKDNKTMIIIAASATVPVSKAEPMPIKSAPSGTKVLTPATAAPSSASPAAAQPKPIPITPAPPKAQ